MVMLLMAMVAVQAAAVGAALHRLEPAASHLLHMAGQSPAEFGHYSAYLRKDTRPLGYTSYLQVTDLLEEGKGARYFSEMRATLNTLGDANHVVLPHVSLSLTPGGSVLPLINAGGCGGPPFPPPSLPCSKLSSTAH